METLLFSNIVNIVEWYHYIFLTLWIILIFLGIKYYGKIESYFKAKSGFSNGEAWGGWILFLSFFLGAIMVTIWLFKPAQISQESELYWMLTKYSLYGIFLILLIVNGYVSYTKYETKSGLLRLFILTPVMIIYFYTGMLGGLLIQFLVLLVILIYFIKKFKKILKIG